MITIGVIHSLTLLQEGWKLLLETQQDYHVINYRNDYRDTLSLQEEVDVVLMDLPQFLRYSEAVSPPSFVSAQTKLAVFIQIGEEHYITRALQAGVHGFLLEEMEEKEFYGRSIALLKGSIIYMVELHII